jgi:hypothetical protein
MRRVTAAGSSMRAAAQSRCVEFVDLALDLRGPLIAL